MDITISYLKKCKNNIDLIQKKLIEIIMKFGEIIHLFRSIYLLAQVLVSFTFKFGNLLLNLVDHW